MNSGMTKKERVLAALYKKETDRIPFSPLCDDYFASSLEKQNHPYDLLRALRYIGADIIERHSPCCEVRYGGGITVESREDRPAAREKRILSQNTARSTTVFIFRTAPCTRKSTFFPRPKTVKVMTHIAVTRSIFPVSTVRRTQKSDRRRRHSHAYGALFAPFGNVAGLMRAGKYHLSFIGRRGRDAGDVRRPPRAQQKLLPA